MANCYHYMNLSTEEKVKLIGEVIHAVQNDSVCFITAKGMISGAKARGVFNGVEVLPPRIQEQPINDLP